MDILKLDIEKTEPDAPSETEARFQIAVLSAVAATAVAFIARFLFDAPLVPELLAHFIFAVAPIWVVEIFIGMLGPFAKHLAFLGCVVLYAIALIAAAMAFLKYFRGKETAAKNNLYLTVFCLSMLVATTFAVIPLLGGGLLGRYLRQSSLSTILSQLIVYSTYGAAIAAMSRLYIERPGSARAVNSRLSRRKVVRAVGYSVLAIGVYDIGWSLLKSWLQSGSGRVKNGDGIFPNINNLSLEITPTNQFYEVSKNPFDPEVDAERWRLEIAGQVENPFSLTFDEIKNLPSVEQFATLACISNQVGGDLIGNAMWRGVRLKELLERAGLREGVVDIVLRASDDYRDSIPLERALADETILVYEMNQAPLTTAHGFPLRLIVPGIYGMKNVKWITRIEAVNYDLKGYWQRRGWDDRAEYKTMSRIDIPTSSISGPSTIAGIAFAGDRGISKVEVSVDGGKSWEQAVVKEPLSQFTWALWHKEWTPARPGKHSIIVRAIDGQGFTQTSQNAPPEPSGSSGYHRRTIDFS